MKKRRKKVTIRWEMMVIAVIIILLLTIIRVSEMDLVGKPTEFEERVRIDRERQAAERERLANIAENIARTRENEEAQRDARIEATKKQAEEVKRSTVHVGNEYYDPETDGTYKVVSISNGVANIKFTDNNGNVRNAGMSIDVLSELRRVQPPPPGSQQPGASDSPRPGQGFFLQDTPPLSQPEQWTQASNGRTTIGSDSITVPGEIKNAYTKPTTFTTADGKTFKGFAVAQDDQGSGELLYVRFGNRLLAVNSDGAPTALYDAATGKEEPGTLQLGALSFQRTTPGEKPITPTLPGVAQTNKEVFHVIQGGGDSGLILTIEKEIDPATGLIILRDTTPDKEGKRSANVLYRYQQGSILDQATFDGEKFKLDDAVITPKFGDEGDFKKILGYKLERPNGEYVETKLQGDRFVETASKAIVGKVRSALDGGSEVIEHPVYLVREEGKDTVHFEGEYVPRSVKDMEFDAQVLLDYEIPSRVNWEKSRSDSDGALILNDRERLLPSQNGYRYELQVRQGDVWKSATIHQIDPRDVSRTTRSDAFLDSDGKITGGRDQRKLDSGIVIDQTFDLSQNPVAREENTGLSSLLNQFTPEKVVINDPKQGRAEFDGKTFADYRGYSPIAEPEYIPDLNRMSEPIRKVRPINDQVLSEMLYAYQRLGDKGRHQGRDEVREREIYANPDGSAETTIGRDSRSHTENSDYKDNEGKRLPESVEHEVLEEGGYNIYNGIPMSKGEKAIDRFDYHTSNGKVVAERETIYHKKGEVFDVKGETSDGRKYETNFYPTGSSHSRSTDIESGGNRHSVALNAKDGSYTVQTTNGYVSEKFGNGYKADETGHPLMRDSLGELVRESNGEPVRVKDGDKVTVMVKEGSTVTRKEITVTQQDIDLAKRVINPVIDQDQQNIDTAKKTSDKIKDPRSNLQKAGDALVGIVHGVGDVFSAIGNAVATGAGAVVEGLTATRDAIAPVTNAINTFSEKYKPMTATSNLLFDGKDFVEWREDVDAIFARTYIGVEYWSSEMCKNEFDVVGDSVLGLESLGGNFQFLGRIEGERSGKVPVLCNATGECQLGTCRTFDQVCVSGKDTANPSDDAVLKQFFYKITYGITAPSDQKLTPNVDEKGAISFNIALLNRNGPTRTVFSDFIHLENGQPKKDVIVKYSSADYHEVCIIFGKKPRNREGKKIDQICNIVRESEKSFQNFQNNLDSASSSGSKEPTLSSDW